MNTSAGGEAAAPRPASFAGLLLAAYLSHGDRECLVMDDDRVTFGELCSLVEQRHRILRDAGVRPGAHVGVSMLQSVDQVATVIAITLARAVAVPINSRYKTFELQAVLPTAGLSAIVASGATYRARLHRAVHVGEVPASAGSELYLYTPTGGATDPWRCTQLPDADGAAAHPSPAFAELAHACRVRDVAVMYFSSGTTSAPKGCQLTHEALTRTAEGTARRMRLAPEDRMLNPQPFFHIGAWQAFFAMLYAGGTFVSMSHFDADRAMRLIDDERISVLFTAFPTLTQELVFHPDYTEASFRHVRAVFTVGPPESLRGLQAAMPSSVLVNAYGSTEAGGSVTMTALDDPIDARVTQGTPFPGVTLQILDDQGAELPADEVGEIAVSGPTLFTGYFSPEGTSSPPEQWRSGDLGRLTAEGRLVYLGRKKDMLKVGGENVSTLEVESYLQSLAGVKMAQVVGVADAKYGEVPVAFVEAAPGAAVSVEALLASCRENLASFKVPRRVFAVDVWPMSATKVKKADLVTLAEELMR